MTPSGSAQARLERHYRSALRSAGEIARRALQGHQKREAALADIDRVTAQALRETPS